MEHCHQFEGNKLYQLFGEENAQVENNTRWWRIHLQRSQQQLPGSDWRPEKKHTSENSLSSTPSVLGGQNVPMMGRDWQKCPSQSCLLCSQHDSLRIYSPRHQETPGSMSCAVLPLSVTISRALTLLGSVHSPWHKFIFMPTVKEEVIR